ncbi:hypothetical protein Misp02_53750 [Microtetraspora sp. NBRC 16547]|nr:hypothetical protein Misp02_53750 [Microtetraspora sp. NBRC 16547]
MQAKHLTGLAERLGKARWVIHVPCPHNGRECGVRSRHPVAACRAPDPLRGGPYQRTGPLVREPA